MFLSSTPPLISTIDIYHWQIPYSQTTLIILCHIICIEGIVFMRFICVLQVFLATASYSRGDNHHIQIKNMINYSYWFRHPLWHVEIIHTFSSNILRFHQTAIWSVCHGINKA